MGLDLNEAQSQLCTNIGKLFPRTLLILLVQKML